MLGWPGLELDVLGLVVALTIATGWYSLDSKRTREFDGYAFLHS